MKKFALDLAVFVAILELIARVGLYFEKKKAARTEKHWTDVTTMLHDSYAA